MKTAYAIKEYRAVADLIVMDEAEYMIARINVPDKHRGQGLGSKLLDMVIADADATGTTLLLHVLPSGPLSYKELCDWYERHGFVYSIERCCYVRTPARTAQVAKP